MTNLPAFRAAALAGAAVFVCVAAALAVGSSSGPGSGSSETIARQAGAADAQEVSLTVDEANARAQEHCRALSGFVGEARIPPEIPPFVVERLLALNPNAFRQRVDCVGERQGGTRCTGRSEFGPALDDDLEGNIAFQRWDGDVAQVLRCSAGGNGGYFWLRIEGIPARPFAVANRRAEARCNELGRCMGERQGGTRCRSRDGGDHAWQRMRPGGEAEVLQCRRVRVGDRFWIRVEGFSNT